MKEFSWVRFGKRKGRRATTVAMLSALGIVVLAVAAVFAVTAQAGVNNQFARVQRAAPAPAGGSALGAPSAAASQSGYVVLKPRNDAALKSFIAGVTKLHSATYHHYLRPGQFASKFGPTAATIAAVKAQLVKDGLTVGTVSRDGLMIPFSGSTQKVESAFDTTLERYRTQAGVTGQLATKAVKLPSSISGDVTAVLGLDTLIHPEADVIRPPASAYKDHAAAKTGKITRFSKSEIAPDPGANSSAGAACKDDAVQTDATKYGGLTDDQIANAYGAFGEYNAGDDGAGVHIALYELEPFAMSDLQTFDQCYFGDSQAKTMIGNVSVKSVDGGEPAGPGSGEAILDIEDISAMAPGANIDVYSAPNTTAGGIDDYAQIVDNDQDQIISSSWGECEQDEALYEPGAQEAENYIFQQAAAQGQTLLSAAGDTGDDTCNEVRTVPPPADQNPLSLDDPSSQPYVMAVGGTTLQDANPGKNYNETVWNDGAQWGGGGGGLSQTWTMPSWQSSSLVPGISDAKPGGTDWINANDVEANAQKLGISDQSWPTGFCQATVAGATANTPCRALPDVSAQADEFTGAVTIYSTSFETTSSPTSGWITIGGTSSATPIWAAMLALVDESSACTASKIAPSSGGDGIGFVPPLLYTIASNADEYAQSFHDITVGNNDVYGFDGGKVFPARAGFDMASGLGSPILTSASGGPGLAANLCDLASSSQVRPTVTGLSSTSGSTAGGQSVTITGTNFTNVSGVQVGGATVTGSGLDVVSPTELKVTMPAGAAAAAPYESQQSDANTGVTYETGGSAGSQDGAGPANVIVTTSGGSSALNMHTSYDYVDENGSSQAIPMVSSVSPYAALESGLTAQGSPQTLTIYGSGFASGDTVKVGGVSATGVTFVSSNELKVTVPAYSSSDTDCVTAAALTSDYGDSDPASDDICQTQVVVTNGNGSSQTATIDPTYEGAPPSENLDGIPEVPVGFELTPQSTEFDYIPTPTITSVEACKTLATCTANTTANPQSLASDEGGTVLKISGQGFNPQTLNWFAVGDPTQYASIDYEYAFYSGSTVYLEAPVTADAKAGTPSVNAEDVPIYADTMGDASAVGQSAGSKIVYAGIPQVTSVSTGTTDSALGLPVAPANSTAGVPLTIKGSGFADSTGEVEFNDVDSEFSQSTGYGFTSNSAGTSITGPTPNSNPAVDDVEVCTVSGCSDPSSLSKTDPTADVLLFYPSGKPVITKLSVTSGPAAGGQTVTITGQNLGCTTDVMFGGKSVLKITPTKAILDCGSTGSVTVVAPPGRAGSSVAVTLKTVESDATNSAAATAPTKFRYTDNPKTSVASLLFGNATPGRNGASRTVTVTNPSGAAALDIGIASITGADKSNFSITKDRCSGMVVKAGKSCAIEVRFAPSKFGKRTAQLKVPFDQSDAPLTVSLSGTGK